MSSSPGSKPISNQIPHVLDLHDIALLLTYERGTTEPRFRHAKLREVARGSSDFQTLRVQRLPQWTQATIPRTGYIFEEPKHKLSKEEADEPDLPSNMLLTPIPIGLQTPPSSKDLEMYFWQPRNHDGCYRTVTLFQHFMDLFPAHTTDIHVRVVELNKPRSYDALPSERLIIEMKLIKPKSMNATCIFPRDVAYVTGGQEVSDHAVIGFRPPLSQTNSEDPEVILDLASLQFGDVGRGFKGRGIFVIDTIDQYRVRLTTYAERNNFLEDKISAAINDAPDSHFLKDVAKRAKARWDKRATDPWCGHCGAPARQSPLLRCSKCHAAHYCNAEHQIAAWTFHKHFCIPPESPPAQ